MLRHRTSASVSVASGFGRANLAIVDPDELSDQTPPELPVKAVEQIEIRRPAPRVVQARSAQVAEVPSEPKRRPAVRRKLAGSDSGEAGARPIEVPEVILRAKREVQGPLLERLDLTNAALLPRDELMEQMAVPLAELLADRKITINLVEQQQLLTSLVDEMLGLGPLEPLLADESITDIMVNGHKDIFVERNGILERAEISFRDDRHVLNIASRIATRIGRRIDESSPLVDARLDDGSRVNIIVPPLSLDGPSISIRKFSKRRITLEQMMKQGNISPALSEVLAIAARCRLNILISGGTGSGKTTLLNAMSDLIDPRERVVTIEDAAELRLDQPNIVRLETRPPNLENKGEITTRDLVKNALRMRPDRIIVGEVRGEEVVDMLQAMNTGHDGSMGTVHANNPREALIRLENLVAMAGHRLSNRAVRTQIVAALDVIIQVSRMRDGSRRVTHLTEIIGMEDDMILTQNLFTFEYEGEDEDGNVRGAHVASGIMPAFLPKARYHSLDHQLVKVLGASDSSSPKPAGNAASPEASGAA